MGGILTRGNFFQRRNFPNVSFSILFLIKPVVRELCISYNFFSSSPTNRHEMCNFYVMYWIEQGASLKQKYCFTAGPPKYYWDMEFNVLPKGASSLGSTHEGYRDDDY